MYVFTAVVMSLQRLAYKLGVGLPFSLPLKETAAELEAYDNWAGKLTYMFSKANEGKNGVGWVGGILIRFSFEPHC